MSIENEDIVAKIALSSTRRVFDDVDAAVSQIATLVLGDVAKDVWRTCYPMNNDTFIAVYELKSDESDTGV